MFFLPFLALTLCSPTDGVASISIFIDNYLMETLDHVNYCVWLHFFGTYHFMPRGRKNHLNFAYGSIFYGLLSYPERKKKQSEFCLCRRREFEPGLPAQQASVLSITPLPLG